MPLRKNLHYNTPGFARSGKRKKKPNIFKWLMIFAVLTTGFVMIKNWNPNKKGAETKETTVAEKVQKVFTPAKKETPPDQTLAGIEKYLDSQVGEYGYSIVEVNSGKSFGNRSSNYYVAASTVKVGIAAYVYNGIEAGRINPNTLLTYTSSDYEGGTGSLQGSRIGSRFKVSYLLERMIKVSDNVATNILIRTYGRSKIQAFLNQNGLSEVIMSENKVTPRVMTKLLVQVEKAQIINAVSKAELISFMKNSITPGRLVAGVPESVEVAHKIGTQVQAISDIGIVYIKNRPYAIAVYSKGITSVPNAEATIRYISKKIFEYENAL